MFDVESCSDCGRQFVYDPETCVMYGNNDECSPFMEMVILCEECSKTHKNRKRESGRIKHQKDRASLCTELNYFIEKLEKKERGIEKIHLKTVDWMRKQVKSGTCLRILVDCVASVLDQPRKNGGQWDEA